ncbi:hypothetical protein NHX12_015663 [Muraenolepis orangiensis]|uniref:Glycosyltransferase 2-like domain-containing protein n=1 Tax=Muraenolepis orangiensis TaxID=630683 RepID=A0A9Q0D8B0_9TELE|nr:hypothetical protein NHX12_015663 [Muraenolepis orangiensis]
MRFKPAKSRSMVLRKGKVVDKFRFNIADTAIPSISEKPVKSLGKVFDCSLRDTSIQSTCTELDGWLKSLDRSGLPGKFKAWVYQHGILPRILWPLLVYAVPISTVETLERRICQYLNSPPSLPPPQEAGLNLNPAVAPWPHVEGVEVDLNALRLHKVGGTRTYDPLPSLLFFPSAPRDKGWGLELTTSSPRAPRDRGRWVGTRTHNLLPSGSTGPRTVGGDSNSRPPPLWLHGTEDGGWGLELATSSPLASRDRGRWVGTRTHDLHPSGSTGQRTVGGDSNSQPPLWLHGTEDGGWGLELTTSSPLAPRDRGRWVGTRTHNLLSSPLAPRDRGQWVGTRTHNLPSGSTGQRVVPACLTTHKTGWKPATPHKQEGSQPHHTLNRREASLATTKTGVYLFNLFCAGAGGGGVENPDRNRPIFDQNPPNEDGNHRPIFDRNPPNEDGNHRPIQDGNHRPIQDGNHRPIQDGNHRPIQDGNHRPIQDGNHRPIQDGNHRPIQDGNHHPIQDGNHHPIQDRNRPILDGNRPILDGNRPIQKEEELEEEQAHYVTFKPHTNLYSAPVLLSPGGRALGNFEPRGAEPPGVAGGPGEGGVAFMLGPDYKEAVQASIKEFGFNMVASDMISLDRTVNDLRHEECKYWDYDERLLTSSVVIVFHNEGWSTLLRTVHSVVKRTPRRYLAEVILIDDFSNKGTSTHYEYYSTMMSEPEEGGAYPGPEHRGPQGRPGPAPISKDRTVCTVPLIDYIDGHSYTVEGQQGGDAEGLARGAWDWSLLWKRVPLGPREKSRRTSATQPYRLGGEEETRLPELELKPVGIVRRIRIRTLLGARKPMNPGS